MRIPEVRERLVQLASVLDVPELAVLAGHLKRRVHGRRTRSLIPPLTTEAKKIIRRYAKVNPDASQLDIANRFGTNPGRVSEALYGKRE